MARILISAGEASGDLYGAKLALAVRERLPDAQISGIGGARMREAGVDLLFDSSSWGAIGIAEALKIAPSLLGVLARLGRRLAVDPPDLLVPIDFGTFNVRLARRACRPTKVLYFLPPGSWRRGTNYARLAGVDRVVTQFPWSAEDLSAQGFAADFFGHPLLDAARPSMAKEEFFSRFELDPTRPLVALLPGSRAHEIVHNLPVMAEASARIPEAQFAVAAQAEVPGAKSIPGMAHDLLAHSQAAVVASGTATLEAAILGCPMVIIYRASALTYLQYKLIGKGIKHVGLPNIVLDRRAVPELLQDEASPERIASELGKLISDSPERERMLADLAEGRSLLGEPGAIDKTADAVVDLLNNEKKR
ncbi:MAG: lipid-A-disaccharide synthase [Armatimonadota bacterium]